MNIKFDINFQFSQKMEIEIWKPIFVRTRNIYLRLLVLTSGKSEKALNEQRPEGSS